MRPIEVYHQRKELGQCTRCGEPAADDSLLCAPHRDAQRGNARRWWLARAERRHSNGECAWCHGAKPAKVPPGPMRPCLACRIRSGKQKPSEAGLDNELDKRRERIAAATWVDPGGRKRYRGQKRRGQRAHAQLNRQDVDLAKQAFQAFEAGVQVLASDEIKELGAGDRDRIKTATASQGERCGRHIDDVLERLGHFQQRHGRRSDDK